MERASLFSHPSIRGFSQIASAFSLLKNATSPVQCASPFMMLQTCQRHTSLSARINNLNRAICTTKYRPIFALSAHNQIKNHTQPLLYPMNQQELMLQRLFSTQHGRHKRTGSYSSSSSWARANRTTATYMTALAIAVVGLSYAAVPLYRIFCQASGYGGTVSVVDPSEKVESMEPIRERELTIR